MNTDSIVAQLIHERSRIDKAIAALTEATHARRRGRKRRKMSAEARMRISKAQKARWAKAKKSA
jgi:hypothetical protein